MRFIGLIILLFLVGCKSKQNLVPVTKPIISGNKSASIFDLVMQQNNNSSDFKTLSIVSSMDYEGKAGKYPLTSEMRLKKDEMIYLNFRFMGISMAKALITPLQVKYYEKAGGTYFEGDFDGLSKWIGVPLSYNMVQNIFLGKTFLPLNETDQLQVKDEKVIVNSTNNQQLITYLFDLNGLALSQQEVNDALQNRNCAVNYGQRVNIDSSTVHLPKTISVHATQNTDSHHVEWHHETIKINEELTFPYNVPDGYERIYAK